MRKCSLCKIEKEFSDFHRKGKGYSHICKECRKIYIRKHYLENKQKYINHSAESTRKTRAWLVELRSSLECAECGETHPACLDFHHIDHTKKELTISMAATYSKSKVLKEMEKCIVLCSNCHRKLHWNEKHQQVSYPSPCFKKIKWTSSSEEERFPVKERVGISKFSLSACY